MLELRAVAKTFGASQVLASVDLTIREGEFFSLLGPSGCGKTTLLRIIAGFETPSSGLVLHRRADITQKPPRERPFNLVFQRYALFPHLNVADNVGFGLRVKGMTRLDTKTRVEEALDLVQMADFCGRSVTTLSGGQQQRVALARALVNRPEVLLLDEPLSALDLKLRQQMQVELLSLQRRLKTTFVFVTHDQEEAMTMSDRIAVMNGGVVEQIASPQELYQNPCHPFVASFIGSVNQIPAEVQEVRPDAIVLKSASRRLLTVRAPRDGSRQIPRGGTSGMAVKMMVRPEKLRVLKSQPPLDQNTVQGTIKEILYKGAVTEFLVQSKEDRVPSLTVLQSNSSESSKRGFSNGDRVFVAWHPEDAFLFPEDVTQTQAFFGETPGLRTTVDPNQMTFPDVGVLRAET